MRHWIYIHWRHMLMCSLVVVEHTSDVVTTLTCFVVTTLLLLWPCTGVLLRPCDCCCDLVTVVLLWPHLLCCCDHCCVVVTSVVLFWPHEYCCDHLLLCRWGCSGCRKVIMTTLVASLSTWGCRAYKCTCEDLYFMLLWPQLLCCCDHTCVVVTALVATSTADLPLLVWCGPRPGAGQDRSLSA